MDFPINFPFTTQHLSSNYPHIRCIWSCSCSAKVFSLAAAQAGLEAHPLFRPLDLIEQAKQGDKAAEESHVLHAEWRLRRQETPAPRVPVSGAERLYRQTIALFPLLQRRALFVSETERHRMLDELITVSKC